MHLSDECFVIFQIGYLFPKHSVFKQKIDVMIGLARQSGFLTKIENDVSWAMQRSSSGKLLQVSSSKNLRKVIEEDRQLSTADTEGIFLLMALGYTVATIVFISEVIGGCTIRCRKIIRQSRKSISSIWSSSSIEPTFQEDASRRNDSNIKKIHRSDKTHKKLQKFELNNQPTKHYAAFNKFKKARDTVQRLFQDYNQSEPSISSRNKDVSFIESSESTAYKSTEDGNELASQRSDSIASSSHKSIQMALLKVEESIDIHVDEIQLAESQMNEFLDEESVYPNPFGSYVEPPDYNSQIVSDAKQNLQELH